MYLNVLISNVEAWWCGGQHVILLIERLEDWRFKASFIVSGADLGGGVWGGLLESPKLKQLTSKACKNIK